MNELQRRVALLATVFGCCMCALLLGMSGQAYAATSYGQNCGGPGGGGGFADPCTVQFSAARPGTARITIDVIPGNGAEVKIPHKWSFDLDKCSGTIMPSDPPRTFTCDFGPGPHTVFVDITIAERVNIRVDH